MVQLATRTYCVTDRGLVDVMLTTSAVSPSRIRVVAKDPHSYVASENVTPC